LELEFLFCFCCRAHPLSRLIPSGCAPQSLSSADPVPSPARLKPSLSDHRVILAGPFPHLFRFLGLSLLNMHIFCLFATPSGFCLCIFCACVCPYSGVVNEI
jgi:hypothetical protein